MWANPFLPGLSYPPLVLPPFGPQSYSASLPMVPPRPRIGMDLPVIENRARSHLYFPGFPAPVSTGPHIPIGLSQQHMVPGNTWDVTYISPYAPLSLAPTSVQVPPLLPGHAADTDDKNAEDKILDNNARTIRKPATAIDAEVAKINHALGFGKQKQRAKAQQTSADDISPNARISNSEQWKAASSIPITDTKSIRVLSPPICGSEFLIPSPTAASTPLKPIVSGEVTTSPETEKVTSSTSKTVSFQQNSNSEDSGSESTQAFLDEPLDLRVCRKAEKRSSLPCSSPAMKKIKLEQADFTEADERINTLTPTKSILCSRIDSTNATKKRKSYIQRKRMCGQPEARNDEGKTLVPLSKVAEDKENTGNMIPDIGYSEKTSDMGVSKYWQLQTKQDNSFQAAVSSDYDSGMAPDFSMKAEISPLRKVSMSASLSSSKEHSRLFTLNDSGLSKSPKDYAKLPLSDSSSFNMGGCNYSVTIQSRLNELKTGKGFQDAFSQNFMPKYGGDFAQSFSNELQENKTFHKCHYPKCSSVFSQAKLLNCHRRNVHGEKSFKCPFEGCGKSYATRSTLRHHQFVHTDTYKCAWPNCGKRFRDDYNLRTHHMTHTGNKPRKCSLCEYSCVQKNSMDWHVKTKHPEA